MLLRVVGDGRGVAAHDAGQRFDRLLVGDHADLLVDLDGVAVQQLELFARLCPSARSRPPWILSRSKMCDGRPYSNIT